MMLMYLIGFVAAIFSAWLSKMFVKAKQRDFFIMELPVYRLPRWKNIFFVIFDKVKIFLFDAGKIIIAISIVLWFLSSRGPGKEYAEIEKLYEAKAELPETTQDELNQLQAQKLIQFVLSCFIGYSSILCFWIYQFSGVGDDAYVSYRICCSHIFCMVI